MTVAFISIAIILLFENFKTGYLSNRTCTEQILKWYPKEYHFQIILLFHNIAIGRKWQKVEEDISQMNRYHSDSSDQISVAG